MWPLFKPNVGLANLCKKWGPINVTGYNTSSLQPFFTFTEIYIIQLCEYQAENVVISGN